MKFLFKNRDFAQSALGLAAGLSIMTLFVLTRSKTDSGLSGLALGMPLGAVLLWLIHALRMHIKGPNLFSSHLLPRPSSPRAQKLGAEHTLSGLRDRALKDQKTEDLAIPPQDHRSRGLAGREPLAWQGSKTSKTFDQWHR
jgi:hypothetical protein